MPRAHRAHAEWTPSRLIGWADQTGPATGRLVAGILERRPHPEQGYRSCLGLMRLGRVHGLGRLDAACRRAEQLRSYRGAVAGVMHHSDQGTQYLSMRYTDRLADSGIAPSVGSRGDAYDHALAESVIGLFKTEVIRRQDPWRSLEAVELATLTWVDWFNSRRLLEPIGYVPPAECEARYYEQAAVA